MFLLNGKALAIDTPFEYEGVRYPANWLRLSTLEEKEAIGITEVVEEARPDDRFYWVTDNGDGTYTATPKDLEDLKSQIVTQVKAIAGTMLAQSDWKIIRQAEGGTAADAETLYTRSAIRERSNAHEASINVCTSVEELAALSFDWGIEPYVAPTPIANPEAGA